MSSYDEHLISMAGGDGDPLDAIQRRERVAADYPGMVTIEQSQSDVPDLLALVRTQQATIDRVLSLANSSGRCGWKISADELRRTLRGES